MQLSIIIAVLESYEVVRRQLLHFKNMRPPSNVEILIVDDGSDPPILDFVELDYNTSIVATEDKRPWSQPCARNTGAEISRGSYLLFTDIDHILSKAAIMDARKGGYDKMNFHRKWGILQKNGTVSQETKTLFEYGLPQVVWDKQGLHGGSHPNTFSIRREIFLDMLHGYDERHCGRYGRDDVDFNKRYSHLCRELKVVEPHVLGAPIYVYPSAREDVKEVFHNIRRVQGRVERVDPMCDECGLIYLDCKCFYPTAEAIKNV
jgi:glycosyltransferase involved in cell wall biosynthesis